MIEEPTYQEISRRLFDLERENEILKREIKTSSTDETILDSFKIEPNLEGEVGIEVITHGGAGHKMLVNWVNFYEANGGKNYFTTTLEGVVRGERKRYEITIRDLVNGNKSPAETIEDLKGSQIKILNDLIDTFGQEDCSIDHWDLEQIRNVIKNYKGKLK
jgi:hypothetical protein